MLYTYRTHIVTYSRIMINRGTSLYQ